MAVTPAERQLALTEVIDLAQKGLAALWNHGKQRDDFAGFIVDAFPDFIDPYHQMAGSLAATWFEESDPASNYIAAIADPPKVERLRSSAEWAMGATGTEGLDRLSGTTQRAVMDGARDTTMLNVKQTGSHWARVARTDACEFCRLLAIRGAVYRSRETATKSHDHCHCIPVEFRGGTEYHPPEYIQQWEEEYQKAVAEAGTGNPKAILSAWRKLDVGQPTAPWERIGAEFSAKYPSTSVHFTNADDPTFLRQFSSGVDHVLQKYPRLQAGMISLSSEPPSTFKADHPDLGDRVWAHEVPQGRTLFSVQFNQKYSTDWATFSESTHRTVDTHFHPGWDGKSPGWAVAVHEMGHAIDQFGGDRARNRAEIAILQHFATTTTDTPLAARARAARDAVQHEQEMFAEVEALGTKATFQQMGAFNRAALKATGFTNQFFADLRASGQLSEYSFHTTSNRLNAGEALAEAFLDVEANGDNASEAAHVLHSILLEEFG